MSESIELARIAHVDNVQSTSTLYQTDSTLTPRSANADFESSPFPSTSQTNFIAALPPVDSGSQAYLFLISATLIEILIWGLPFSVGILHAYWINTLFEGQGDSVVTLAATLQTGLLYMGAGAFGPFVSERCC